jgi:hypothetical protein
MIVASVALFVSLSGVSYGVATGFIDSREIKNNEVRSLDIRNNEIRTGDLRNNQVRGIDIRNSTVQGRDLALNTVTGEDVNEGSLQKVPSALLADTAANADAADTVTGLKIIDATVSKNADDAVLATQGPLTLLGQCSPGGAGATSATLGLDTTEDNSAGGDQTSTFMDIDAVSPPSTFADQDDAVGGSRSAHVATVWANTLSGPAFAGELTVQALATSPTAGSCRFHGFVTLQG